MKMLNPMHKKDEELGRYASYRSAQKAARRETSQTGVKHHVRPATYFSVRDWKSYGCYTIILK